MQVAFLSAIAAFAVAPGCTASLGYDECKVPGQCHTEDSKAACTDGVDNDEDGLTDCFDPGCHAWCSESSDALCSDGRDNDGDGAIDCEDPSCGETDTCRENTEAKCSDGRDTDLDGDTDCADTDCCGTRVCHNLARCGEPVLETRFSDGIDSADWIEYHATTGYHVPENTISVGPEGATLQARSGCYTYAEEVGLIARPELDLTQGRFVITARMQVPEDTYWPAWLGLVPQATEGRFAVLRAVQNPDMACGTPITTVDSTDVQTPVIALRIYGEGSRELMFRIGQEVTFVPEGAMLFPVPGVKAYWDVRIDIDDDEIVLFEGDASAGGGGGGDAPGPAPGEARDATWLEIARVPNPLPGRVFHLAFGAATDQDRYDQRFTVQSAGIYRVPRGGWQPALVADFGPGTDTSGWSIADPEHCAVDASSGTLYAVWEAAAEDRCLVPLDVPWTGGLLRLEYDLYVSQLDWAAAFAPTLTDAAELFIYGTHLGGGFGVSDQGTHTQLFVCSTHLKRFVDPAAALRRWLRVRAFYDPKTDLAEVRIFDRETEAPLDVAFLESAGCAVTLSRFGVSSVTFNRYDGQTGAGRIDRVRVWIRPEEGGAP